MNPEMCGAVADVIAVFHTSFVLFVVLALMVILIGGPLGWRFVRNPWFRGIHLWMTVIVPFEMVFLNDFECPVTTWEWDYRVDAKQLGADFRYTQEMPAGFIAERLHAFIPGERWVLPAIFAGFGLAVLGSFFCFPPRQLALVLTLNVCSLAVAFVCWIYAGEPQYWGSSTWPHGIVICLWNVLPFVLAAAMAIQLRRRRAASALLCVIVLWLSWRGLFILSMARLQAGESGLGAMEWAMPIAEMLVLFAVLAVARLMMIRQPEVNQPEYAR